MSTVKVEEKRHRAGASTTGSVSGNSNELVVEGFHARGTKKLN